MDSRTEAVNADLAKLMGTALRFHKLGDVAQRAARTAPNRRAERHFIGVNRTARAVGESASATLWLFDIFVKGMKARNTRGDVALPVMQRFLAGAKATVDEHVFEAVVADAYRPQQQKKETGR